MDRRRSTSGEFAPPLARAAYRYPRTVSDREFIQRVRRHTPSSLPPLIAAAAAANWEPSKYRRHGRTHLAPWGLAEIARVSLIHGTAFNRTAATEDDLLSCLAAYQAATDLDLERQKDDALFLFMLRMADQLRYQQSIYNDMCRAIAL